MHSLHFDFKLDLIQEESIKKQKQRCEFIVSTKKRNETIIPTSVYTSTNTYTFTKFNLLFIYLFICSFIMLKLI